MLQVGKKAPNFCLPDADMKMVSLSSFKNKKNIVLYFYPKDDTAGCTTQALELSDLGDQFAKFNTVIQTTWDSKIPVAKPKVCPFFINFMQSN